MKVVQRTACELAEQAKTPEELERAHLAMRAAFPGLARAYPCSCEGCTRVVAGLPEMPWKVRSIVERLTVADELETAERVAKEQGLGLVELLDFHAPRSKLNRIAALYEVLDAKGYSSGRIAHMTGREATTVRNALNYRRDAGFRERRLQAEKMRGAS